MIIINYSLSCIVYTWVVPSAQGMAISCANRFGPQSDDRCGGTAQTAAPLDSGKVAEHIGIAVLELADRARDAELSSIGYLLEMVALEAGAEAAARQWPADGADS